MDADERNRKDTKRSEVCFWDLNPDGTHLEILQETMRLIVLMVFVYLVMIKGIFHSVDSFTVFSFMELKRRGFKEWKCLSFPHNESGLETRAVKKKSTIKYHKKLFI